ncbi:DUF1048 domain-containing protein [Actinosynnema sp. NPDC023794]
MGISDLATKVIGDKRRWRAYKARTRQLPAHYRTAVDALERYLMHFGPSDGDTATSMYEDLADLFERAAADGTPIRDVVGQDPADFAEAFLQNYAKGGWVTKERERLATTIALAEAESRETRS